MSVKNFTIEEKRIYIKKIFRGYRKMTKNIERTLEELGFTVVHTKSHIKLFYQDKLFLCPTTASDVRSGMNLASIICRTI